MDSFFRVEVLAKTPNPQQLVYAAMHQDYSEGFVFDERDRFPDERKCGEILVKRLLAGGRGHFGCCEHPQISFSIGYFPHSTMQQIRTHRLLSMDVQSGRYTSVRILDCYNGNRDIEEVFYLRPVGSYADRQGGKFEYTESDRALDLRRCKEACQHYALNIEKGMPEEQARGTICFDIRQHWVLSVNARSLMHLFDLRAKADAQLECQQLCELMRPHFEEWMPELAQWYITNRWGKAKLAP